MISVEEVRKQIPLLSEIVYADNAATTLKPKPVLDAMMDYMQKCGANVERGSYRLAQEATDLWDRARKNAAQTLLNCRPEEMILTKSTTEAINIAAASLERPLLDRISGKFSYDAPLVKWQRGDSVVSTVIEHHSNIMPWMRLCAKSGAKFIMISPSKEGLLLPEHFEEAVDQQTRVVAIQHASNCVGSVHNLKEIIKTIRVLNSKTLVCVDGSQAVGHMPINVKELGCDFYAFSGHKGPLGPQGTGGLYVRSELLSHMEPLLVGGGAIADVTERDYKLRSDSASKRFDAGTPNIAGMIGLGKAAEYVGEIGLKEIEEREKELAKSLIDQISGIKGISVYGPNDMRKRCGVVSFNIEGWRCQDVSLTLDEKWKIITRAGHHCCLPAIRFFGLWDSFGGNVRASFAYYNTEDEVAKIAEAVKKIAGG
jgi:cysteine desulfurase/selenocysteine lyase